MLLLLHGMLFEMEEKSMSNEQAARELAKLLVRPLEKMIKTFIEDRCYLVMLEILKNIESKEGKSNE